VAAARTPRARARRMHAGRMDRRNVTSC